MRETRQSVRNIGLWQVLGTEQPDLVKVPWKAFCYYMHCECVPLIEWMKTIKPSTDFCLCWQNCMYIHYNYKSPTVPNPTGVKSITYSNYILWILFLNHRSFIYKCGFVLQQTAPLSKCRAKAMKGYIESDIVFSLQAFWNDLTFVLQNIKLSTTLCAQLSDNDYPFYLESHSHRCCYAMFCIPLPKVICHKDMYDLHII